MKAQGKRDEEVAKAKTLYNTVQSLLKKINKRHKSVPDRTDEIMNKDYSIELNYENYWFANSKYMLENLSDSRNSSDSSIQEINFTDKVHFSS